MTTDVTTTTTSLFDYDCVGNSSVSTSINSSNKKNKKQQKEIRYCSHQFSNKSKCIFLAQEESNYCNKHLPHNEKNKSTINYCNFVTKSNTRCPHTCLSSDTEYCFVHKYCVDKKKRGH